MKTFLKYGGAMAAIGLLATSAQAVLLSDLINGNGSLSIGGTTFADFGFGVNSTVGGLGQTTGAGDINVSVGWDGAEGYFLQLQGNISSGVGGHVDLALRYSVTALGGLLINGIDQAFNFAAGGNGGTLIVAESANANGFPPVGNEVARSTISFVLGTTDANDPAGELGQGDQLVVPNLTGIFVATDMRLFAADGNSIVSSSVLHQSYHLASSVPDGGSTLLLLGSAMSCLSFLRWRRMS